MRKIKGRLVSTVKTEDGRKPISNASLQLWDLDIIKNDFLVAGSTDEAGYFDISYDPNKGNRWNDVPDLVLRFMDREYSYDKSGKPISKWFVVKSFHGGNNIKDAVFDFGVLEVAFWEYEDKEGLNNICFTPRVAIIDKKTPQSQRPGRTNEQVQVGLKHFAPYNKHKLITKFSNHHPSNDSIEGDYIANRTRKIKKKSRSDAFLSDMVLNGFNPCNLKKGSEHGRYFVDFKWNGLELDKTHFAPNTTANFKLSDDNELILESIALQKRLGGDHSAHANYRKPKIYTPEAPEWDRVKRIFRCNYFLFGEVGSHLAETHLNVEQYIIPIRRNLLNNPIARLLLPHFYGTTDVNMAANDLLIDSEGLVQKCSALTKKSVEELAKQAFGTYNWYGWTPRKPLCKGHSFAEIGQLYWKILNEYVTKYVHENMSQIKHHWREIKTMSDELVFHSLPYVHSSEHLFYDSGEINTSSKIHPYVNGKESAISPVTVRDSPESVDIGNIIQFCCYLIFHATFKHSWINDLQYDMGGEIEFATLGITDDISNMRVDQSKVVPSTEALEHPFITYILNYTEYGYVMRNEDDDVNPELIKHLVGNRAEFQKLNYDIRAMRSCINI